MTTPEISPEFLSLQSALRGRYVLERELGRGGMGVVFLARDVALDRPVAIKVLPPHFGEHPEYRRRFLVEARTAARLAHPHIVPVHAVEEHGDLVCFVMGYVAGVTLAERVREEGPLPVPAATRLVQEVAWALAYAHQQGVVHRDVKPENILLERGSGRALVTDFGIARLLADDRVTPHGELVGTARLMSPEQAAGHPADARSDLYALGVTGFFALTGRYPFEAREPAALLAQHVAAPAPPVASLRRGLPPALARAVDRCLAKNPTDRFASGEELAQAVAPESVRAALVPPALGRLAREMAAFGVDLAGYLTLALVMTGSLMLAHAEKAGLAGFWGALDAIYLYGIGILLVTLSAVRGLQAIRLTREALREGWTHSDFLVAVRREARQQAAEAAEQGRRWTDCRAAFAIWLGGLVAVALVWLSARELADQVLSRPGELLVELLALLIPIGLGRWFGTQLEAPRDGKPGLISRFWSGFKSRWLFRVAGIGLRRKPAEIATLEDRPTEVLLADGIRALLEGLPSSERAKLDGVRAAITKLEDDARVLRLRTADDPQAGRRLATAVSALESLRLDLLRYHAGLATTDSLTEDLADARRIAEKVDREVGGPNQG